MKKWLCDGCGYLSEQDETPGSCPRCKTTKFILQNEDKNLANISIFSKEVQSIMKLDSLLGQALETCAKGNLSNTCATCKPLFNKTRDDINALREQVKKEINNHISRGNWG